MVYWIISQKVGKIMNHINLGTWLMSTPNSWFWHLVLMASSIPENPRQGHVLAKSSIGKQRLELCMSQHFRDRLLAVVGFDHPILVCPILINFDSCPNRFFSPEKQTPRPLSFRKKRMASVSPLCGSKKRLGFRWWVFFAEWPRKTRGSAGL